MSATKLNRRGLMLVISSPSGAGKTTLARRLLANDGNSSLSISVTTRPPRDGEVHGRDYIFVSREEFEKLKAGGEFLEYAEVFGNFYGTPKAPVEQALEQGRDVLFDVDWQGTQQLTQSAGGDLAKVFILPPSADMLAKRLMKRGQDSAQVIAQRMDKAADEISHWNEYDYVLINDDLDRCYAELWAILMAERAKKNRQLDLNEFVRRMRDEL